ncbi:hypothetical protein ABL78_4428 [Leptomonas seymouri]|uniref:Uncharacterized protein n=1 Tax=Leptomonas seymouri TaxID=5684 RepID=A0A0N1I4V9_LEPSE|nr:hypothetical protein ABL78_4428 [Leptomonas seymouri]|eukprot:KPI86488.1 hypothetical protein ABL78_4428 [Leptomonas seymouri]
MTSAFPEWQAEEIVEDVPEFLDGKRRDLPVALVRHRGRIPPKRSARNSLSPRFTVDVQTLECQSIADELIIDSLGAPSPLNLQVDSGKPPEDAERNATIAASSQAKDARRVGLLPDGLKRRSSAVKGTICERDNYRGNRDNNDTINKSNHYRLQPPATRAQDKLPDKPLHGTTPVTNPSKSTNSMSNRSSLLINNTNKQLRSLAVAAPSTCPTTTITTAVKPSPQSPSVGLKPISNMKSTPSLDSLDECASSISSTDSGWDKDALPFSAPAGQCIPAIRRDLSAPAPRGREGSGFPHATFSVDIPAALTADPGRPPLATARQLDNTRHMAPTAANDSDCRSVPVKPKLLASCGGDAAACTPQPSPCSRKLPQKTSTTALPSTTSKEVKLASMQPLPPMLPNNKSNITSGSKNKVTPANAVGDSRTEEARAYSYGDLLLGEQESRSVGQSTRKLSNSVASSAGYSVCRDFFDSYATLDLGSTLPSMACTATTRGATAAISPSGSVRPQNMMAANGATALRAKSSFARLNSIRRKALESGAPGQCGTAQPTADNAQEAQMPKPACAAAKCTSQDERPGTGIKEEAEDKDVHDKHRKRAPQTKRTLRRRNTEFEKL